jgi:hypothetical protein
MTSKLPEDRFRCPLDVKIVGLSWILWGVVCFLGTLSYLLPPYAELPTPQYILFGVVSVSSELWGSIYWIFDAGLSVAVGYWLLRLRPYGWWILVVEIISGSLNGLRALGHINPFGVMLTVAFLGWAIFRFPLYSYGGLFKKSSSDDIE